MIHVYFSFCERGKLLKSQYNVIFEYDLKRSNRFLGQSPGEANNVLDGLRKRKLIRSLKLSYEFKSFPFMDNNQELIQFNFAEIRSVNTYFSS